MVYTIKIILLWLHMIYVVGYIARVGETRKFSEILFVKPYKNKLHRKDLQYVCYRMVFERVLKLYFVELVSSH
jgi:hypothetical protein